MSYVMKNKLIMPIVILMGMMVVYASPSFCQELFPLTLPGGFEKEDSLVTFNLETLYKYLAFYHELNIF